jgi:hypothetical protein
MSMEFGLLNFPYATFKLSEITQSLLSTNVAVIIHLGNVAQTLLGSQMLNHDIASIDAA